jgi:L-2,4-diaminobutyrate decarboxylase
MKKFNDFREPTDPTEIKTVGYKFVDMIADYMDRIHNVDAMVVDYLTPDKSYALFDEPIPQNGMELEEILDQTMDPILKHAQNLASPAYMGHQVCHPLILSAFAKGLTSAINQGLAIYEMSPTGTMIEKRVMRWLCDAVGYDENGDGTLVSGGTEANLTGIMVARTIKAGFDIWKDGVNTPMVGFCSGRSHYSVERAFGMLGLGTKNLVKIKETPEFKMDTHELVQAVEASLKEKKKPFIVIATAGCTPVGSFDDIERIAEICKKFDLWLHVDGAHGGSFIFSDKLKPLLKGIDRADSISLDPHKMMFMPLSLGTVMVKNQNHFEETFKVNAPYIFNKTQKNLGCLNIGERTIQCSRGMDAFKLWICLKHYGIRYFADMMDHCTAMTHYLYERLEHEEDFEPLNRPESNILCFQHIPETLKSENQEAIGQFNFDTRNALNQTGKAWITTTIFAGKRLMRTTIINPRTNKEHVDQLIKDIREVGKKVMKN